MITDTQLQEFIRSTRNMLEEYNPIELGKQLRSCDALFAFRILYGRMPTSAHEIEKCFSVTTYRQYINSLLEAPEFSCQLGFMPGGRKLMTDENGFRFWFNSSDREMGAVMATAGYEKSTVNLLRNLIKPGMRCVDVGAQTGFFTCLLGQLVGEDGFVWAFEPMPSSIDLVQMNIKENSFENRIKLFPFACATKSGELAVDIASGMAVASSNGTHKFISVAIDDLIQEPVDFCKIDVEGHEPSVISGMQKLLTFSNPIILTEFNQYWLSQAGASIHSYANQLRSFNYDLFNVDGELTPFNDSIDYEVLANFNVLAVPHGMSL